jgi:PAS domain-containing protein
MNTVNEQEVIKNLTTDNVKLQARLNEYRIIFDSSSDIILLVEASSGKISNVNNQLRNCLGTS